MHRNAKLLSSISSVNANLSWLKMVRHHHNNGAPQVAVEFLAFLQIDFKENGTLKFFDSQRFSNYQQNNLQ
jgi:hypothetical protein